LVLGQLAGGLPPEHHHRLCVQCDQPSATLGLGLGLDQLPVDRHQRALDGNSTALDI
jgi:hypothetical protein